MSDEAKDDVGAANGKISDTDIQGVKAGKRNRAETEAGVMPPPAGETREPANDPRREAPDKRGE
jgi:hypothetical protein